MNLPFKLNYKKVLKFGPFQLFFLLQFGIYIYIYIRFLQDQVHHHSNRIYEMKELADDKSLRLKGLFFLWFQIRALWLFI
jgi:hypothetical protein